MSVKVWLLTLYCVSATPECGQRPAMDGGEHASQSMCRIKAESQARSYSLLTNGGEIVFRCEHVRSQDESEYKPREVRRPPLVHLPPDHEPKLSPNLPKCLALTKDKCR